ncbi:MAG: PIN/TRAM domain-containing protein [Planctomycetaceae bacterium]
MNNLFAPNNIAVWLIRIVYVFVCAGAIATYLRPGSGAPSEVEQHPILTFFVLLGITQLATVVDLLVRKKRIEVISAVYFGLMIGFLLSYLVIQAVQPIFTGINLSPYYRNIVVMVVSLGITYVCVSFLVQTRDDFRFVIPYVEFSRELKGTRPMILDSSALIDGRIADLVETQVIDSPLIVPQFVLLEIQDIADSNDKMRRTRGRRGLEVLSKLQNSPHADVKVRETSDDNLRNLPVDQRLIEVAKQLSGRVVTNDFNLNKVAAVQGVEVVNLNDVANALKPRYLPGERLRTRILKEGESQGQGVGYLDDGTMVVCEASSHLVGQDIDVIVTSVLQSSAGRMIFGRQVHPTAK